MAPARRAALTVGCMPQSSATSVLQTPRLVSASFRLYSCFGAVVGRPGGMAMSARLSTVAILSLFSLVACSQSGASAPTGSALPLSSAIAKEAAARQPLIRYFNSPVAPSWPEDIVAGPQGALWFSDMWSASIGSVTADGTTHAFPLAPGYGAEGLTEGSDGNIWFTEPGANQIGRMTPQGVVTSFPIAGASNPSPRGITLGPDGNVWYVEYYDGYLGRVTPQGAITRFQI